MAETYLITDAETNKTWSKEMFREWRKSDAIWDDRNGFLGDDHTKNVIYKTDELEKSAGDEVTITLRLQLAGDGVVGDEVLEGKEAAIDTTTFKMKIDDHVQGWRSRGIMTGQRVNFDALKESKDALADWWKTRRAVCAVNHLCGNTRQTKLTFTANNAPQAPDTQHIYRAGSGGGLGLGDDATVGGDATAKFDLQYIDRAVTLAEALQVPIKPFEWKGAPYYGMFVHPFCIEDLRNTSSQWYDMMIKGLQGGKFEGNPLFTRAVGMYRNCLIFSEPHLVQGTSNAGAAVANTRRCVFLGAGALAMAYGRSERGTMEKFRWHSSTWDHGRKFFGSAGLVWGLKAPRFTLGGTPRDYGKIVFTFYSADRVPYVYGNTTTYDLGQTY
jgi:N4-gp56 family major capsid protein